MSVRDKKINFFNRPISVLKVAVWLAVFLLVFSLIVPVSYTKAEQTTLKYEVEEKEEKSIEMGVEKIAQKGKEGLRDTKYRYKQSLFNYIFRRDSAKKAVIEFKEVKEPKKKLILIGTRKWQYMMCSNGTYRYFTNEQFKDKHTGFTSTSSDYCKENDQGHKIGLADDPNGNSTAAKPSYVPSGCTSVDVPYKTVYKDASWLNKGETSVSNGHNGYKYECTNKSYEYAISPIDKIIYRGTYETSTTYTSPNTSTDDSKDYSAKYVCDSDYSSAKAQIIAGNAGNSSAMDQLNHLYSQCLSRAGF